MTTILSFRPPEGSAREVRVERAVVAGFTGRDQQTVEHHIAELAELGVAPPSEVPLFFRVGAALLTDAPVIETLGENTSGEAEPVLFDDGDTLWLGLGSDHTDRALEAYSVALSKQICPKPIAGELWPWAGVRAHLDKLQLRSWIRDTLEAEWTLYQEGTLGSIRPLPELIARSPVAAGGERLEKGRALLCGTLGAIGGVRSARFFRMELRDPVLGRVIEHDYETTCLPIVS